MMMPEAWCSAGARPGKAVKSGNSESATVIRNARPATPAFHPPPESFGQGARINEVEVEELGVDPRGNGCGTDGFTLVRLNADGLPILDKDLAHLRH